MSGEAWVQAKVGLDPERQALARRRARDERCLMVAELAVAAALAGGWLVSGASAWLEAVLLGVGLTSAWTLTAAYLGLVLVGYALLTLPLAWWSGYVHPHRYGLSTQTPRSWLAERCKSLGLSLGFGVAAGDVVYWLLRTFPDSWWLWASAFLLATTVFLSFVAPVLILPIFYKLTPLDDAGLVARIRRLAERTGRRVAGVYTINLSTRTTAANAVLMGLGRTQRIALGDTLYADYDADEIEAIVAHELGHQAHRDLCLGLALQGALLVGSLYLAHLFLGWGVARFGLAGPADVAGLPLVLIAVGVFSLATMPLANGFSRWRERLADRFSIEVTGKPAAFARAMARLANQNLAEADPPQWAVWLFYSHPPIGERIAMARNRQ